MFEALYEAGINIQMINTSEIRVSVLLDEEDVNRAVRGHPRQVLRRDLIPPGASAQQGAPTGAPCAVFRSAPPPRCIQWSEVRRTMRDPFNRFALRYLAAVVCGLALLLLHSTAQSGLPAAFVPQCPSPWELSKLAFWPLLAAWC